MPDTPEQKGPETIADEVDSRGGDPGAIYAPRPADSESGSLASPSPIQLPPAKDVEKLKLATSDMVEFGISLKEAADLHGVDLDTLHVWYRTYVNFVGDDIVEEPAKTKLRGVDHFDQATHRHFDMNWAEMVYQADQARPQMSPVRRWLVSSPITGWMFEGDVVDKIAVSGVACVIGLGILAVIMTRSDWGGAARVEEQPASATDLVSADLQTLDADQTQLVLKEIVQAMEEFVSLETWQERLPHVRSRQKVAPLMESYYRTHPDGPIASVQLNPNIEFLQRSGDRFAIVTGMDRSESSSPRPLVFMIQLVGEEPNFLFDWELLVNYEPYPWKEFVATRSTGPAPFRVRLTEGDYYNGHFLDSGKYIGFKAQRMGTSDEIFVYATRGSEIASRVESKLGSNLSGWGSMVLDLRFPDDAKFDNLLEIDSIVSDSW